MKFPRGSAFISLILGLVAAGQGEIPPAAHPKTLAILLPPSSPLADALSASFALQGRFTLADPKDLAEVLKDHPLVLTAKTSSEDVSYFGKLVQADYLLTVQPDQKQAIIRLVQTSTGKVITDSTLVLSDDPFQEAAAVRECIAPTINPADSGHKPAADSKQEIKYWRDFAQSLMPQSSMDGSRAPFDVFAARDRANAEMAVAAWERVLMMDPKDNEALLNLGVCFVSLTQHQLNNNQPVAERDAQMALKGTQLVEAAFLGQPNAFNGASYYQLINPLEGQLPERALKMNEFIVEHAKDFPDWAVKPARLFVILKYPERLAGEIEAAVAQVKRDPEAVASLFYGPLSRPFHDEPRKRIAVAAPYTESKDAVTRFFSEFVIAETLRTLKDPAALDHYDRMLEVQEEAYAELPKSGQMHREMDDVVRDRYNACLVAGKTKEAKKTILRGAEHFRNSGRFDSAIAWVYYFAVTQVLGDEDPKAALVICDAYLTAKAKSQDGGDEDWARQVAEYQAVHTLLLAGQKVPDFSALQLIVGTAGHDLGRARLAAGAGKIWLAWHASGGGGPGMVFDPAEDRAVEIPELPKQQLAVATIGSRIFFGGFEGLFELNADGQIVRHFTSKDGELPAKSIVDLCAAGDDLIFSFRDGDRYGVASLHPTTGKITQLAPTNPKATLSTEPVYDAYRVWYNAAQDQIVVNNDGSTGNKRMSWTYDKGAWAPPQHADLRRGGAATLACISQGKEVLTISTEKESLLLQLKNCKDIALAQPYVWKVIEPAWDAKTVYLPTFTGLYSVARSTGEKTWLAHQTDTPVHSSLIHENALYLITSRGLYRYALPK